MVHYDACPLCSSDRISVLFRCTDHFISHEKFPVAICGTCGFIFTQERPGETEAGKYYESVEYISHSDSAAGLINKLYRVARNLMLRKKVNLVRKMTGLDEGSILDIGSGTGHFPASMKKAGWNARGIEINRMAREQSISSFGLDVIDPSGIRTLESGSFDCITLWHVLEHFDDPDAYMKEIDRLLKPGGICIIALPNCSSFDALHYGSFWAAWDVPRHLWHFTPDTFGRFASKAGFDIRSVRSLPLDVFYISSLSEKYKGSGMYFIKGMVKGIIWWFIALIRKNRSSSLIYILKKSTRIF